jgi:hypothetical protein
MSYSCSGEEAACVVHFNVAFHSLLIVDPAFRHQQLWVRSLHLSFDVIYIVAHFTCSPSSQIVISNWKEGCKFKIGLHTGFKSYLKYNPYFIGRKIRGLKLRKKGRLSH